MQRYLVVRILWSGLTLVGISTVVFFALHLSGDPAALMLPPDASRDEIAAFRHARGFDDPLAIQYGHFLTRLLQGDLGESLRYPQPALAVVAERLPATLQ